MSSVILILMRKKCNLWMFLAIASIGMHFYRTLQTINNISISIPTNSQQNDNMLVEQMVLNATATIDIEQPTHAQVCDPQNFLKRSRDDENARSSYLWRNETLQG